MNEVTIAFIGAGNMAQSLICGLIADGYDANKLYVGDPNSEKLRQLQQQFSINVEPSNNSAAEQAAVIVIAVKPQALSAALGSIQTTIITKKPLIISIAAGIQIDTILRSLTQDTAVVRCMPNTPALIRCGATALYANTAVNDKQKQLAESIMRAVGIAVWVDEENQLDIVTALSGSGPAYFFLFMEALANAAIKLGLTSDIAELLTRQTALGAARMAIESDIHINELRDRVTSPGGTTEAALKIFSDNNLSQLIETAVCAADQRAKQLAELLQQ